MAGRRSRHTMGFDRYSGMTLRDYFAAAALTGDLARLSDPDAVRFRMKLAEAEGVGFLEATAKIAYEHADAMMAERGSMKK